ncbi:hypothetical protein QL285_017322 [Trifolium repens]|nr:hypothetical protein QL285_017322 [Trifolium repens]
MEFQATVPAIESLPNCHHLTQKQMGVSKKLIAKSSKVEPSLVEFILKLNLIDIMGRYVAKNEENLAFYCCGLPNIKAADNVCNKKTKPVAGREALMTILAKFNENGLHVHRFVRELALVLSLYNQIISGTGFNWFSDLEDEEAVGLAFLAREKEIIAEVERERMAKFERRKSGNVW